MLFDARLPERFWARVAVEPNSGCWLWMGGVDGDGYSRYRRDSQRMDSAHRAAYEALISAIPAGLQIDHKCRVRCCVNPAHLEPVTARTNTLRSDAPSSRHAKKTCCPFGHPYDNANTYRSRGSRNCRQCGLERARRKLAAQKLAKEEKQK